MRGPTGDGGWVLALDTSTPEGSVALGRGEEVRGVRRLGPSREHAARLVPAIGELLEGAGVERVYLARIAAGAGPGSFTGVRVAGATAMGLAAGLGVPVRGRSSLLALACSWMAGGRETREPGEVLCTLFDARGDRLYAAWFSLGAAGPEPLGPPLATRVGELLAAPPAPRALFLGDGALRHRARIEEGGDFRVVEPGVTLAEGHLLAEHLDLPAFEGDGFEGWQAEYLRGSSAVPSVAAGAGAE